MLKHQKSGFYRRQNTQNLQLFRSSRLCVVRMLEPAKMMDGEQLIDILNAHAHKNRLLYFIFIISDVMPSLFYALPYIPKEVRAIRWCPRPVYITRLNYSQLPIHKLFFRFPKQKIRFMAIRWFWVIWLQVQYELEYRTNCYWLTT